MPVVKYRAASEIDTRGRRVPAFLNHPGIRSNMGDGVTYTVETEGDAYIVTLNAPPDVHTEIQTIAGVVVVP